MKRLVHISLILILSLFLSCNKDDNKSTSNNPSVIIDNSSLNVSSVSMQVNIKFSDAEKCSYKLIKKGESKPTANDVISTGNIIKSSPYNIIISNLTEETTYELYVAAKNSSGEIIENIEFTTTKIETLSNHTLVLYMMGSNSGLEAFMDANINKILASASKVLSNNNHIIIYYDRGNYTRLTEIYLEDGRTKQRVVKEYNPKEVSSVDVNFMKEVLQLIKETTKTETYGIVLSSHGGGWVPSNIFDEYLLASSENNISHNVKDHTTKFFGQDGYDYMEIPELSAALSDFHTDYIIFDACFMASVEALYDLRNNTDYIIASPTEILGDGFPFKEIIPILFQKTHNLRDVCEEFMKYYDQKSGTISLIKTSELENLASTVKDIIASSSNTSIDASTIQGFEGFDPHIYYDFEEYISAISTNKALLYNFREQLRKVVTYNRFTPTFYSDYGKYKGTIKIKNCCGLSCHIKVSKFPNTHKAYLKTEWAKTIGAK